MREITGNALTMALALALASAATGCGRDGLDRLKSAPRSALRVVPDSATLFLGQTLRFDVEQVSGAEVESVLADPELALRVTTPGVAELDGATLRAVAPGRTQLEAALGSAVSRANVEVLDATLQSLSVEPDRAQLAEGALVQLAVTGQLSDGGLVDLTPATSGTQYASDRPNVAEVDPNGLIRAVAPGSATITVNQAGVAADVTIVVVPLPADIIGLRLEPSSVVLERGESTRVRVLGVGAEETVLPPSVVEFTIIGDQTLARVDAEGVVTARSRVGTGALRARFRGLEATAEIRVISAVRELTGLRIEPNEAELEVGEFVQLAVIASFDDGLSSDVSSDPDVAYSIEGPAGVATVTGNGLVVGASAGDVVVRAAFRGASAATEIRVRGDSPVAELTIEPRPVALEVGASIALRVTARLQSGEQTDVTAAATFLPPPNGALEFDSSTGRLTGVAEGFGTFGFTFGGVTARASYVVVEGIEDLELRFDPDPLVVETGAEVEFDLIAVLGDGTSVDLTFLPGVLYEIDDPTIAAVDPGLVRGRSNGSTRLRATASNRTAEVTVDVIPGGAELTGIVLSAPAVVNLRTPAQLRVIAQFSDGTGQDVTTASETSLTSDAPAVVAINGANLVGLQEGEARITARFRGFEDAADVAVESGANTLLGLTFQPSALLLDVPETGQVQLFAQRRFGDENVSADSGVVLTRSPEVGVEVGSAGVEVTALRGGAGRVRAFYQGLSATLPVTVRGASVARLRIDAPEEIGIGETASARVLAVLTDGSEVAVDAPAVSDAPSIARISASGRQVEGVASGETQLRASFFDFSTAQPIRVSAGRVPTITRLVPGRLPVDSPARSLTIQGTGFVAGATVRIGGQPVTPTSVSGSAIELDVPPALVSRPTRLTVQVFNPGGLASNPASLQIGEPPQLDELVPDVVVPGQTVRVRALGDNLYDLRATPPFGWTIGPIDASGDGRSATFDVTVPNNNVPGQTLDIPFRNDLGLFSGQLTVRAIGPALSVTGETRLTGVQVVRSLDVEFGGTLASNGPNAPLVFLVRGDATISGLVDGSGLDGRREPTPRGGEGGPGGAGGGAGGNGDASTGALGGSGQPAGDSAPAGTGAGSEGGDGGGRGGGSRATGDCGAGGGGGAGVGSGGDGAAGSATSVPGPGGSAPGRSSFSAGTGGGGGNDCDVFSLPGAAGGSGGGGGGLIEIQVLGGATLIITGTVQADGGQGGEGLLGGGGGGGSGGMVRLLARGGTIDLGPTARVSAVGGAGGASRGFGTGAGGGGGGGLITLDAGPTGSIVGAARADLDVAGGAAGSVDAEAGEAGQTEQTP